MELENFDEAILAFKIGLEKGLADRKTFHDKIH
jgi:hypothetical protein